MRGAVAEATEHSRVVRAERLRLVGRANAKRHEQIVPERVAELLEEPPRALLGMRVQHYLLRARGWGPYKVNRVMLLERIRNDKRIRDLTERQRLALIERLRAQ